MKRINEEYIFGVSPTFAALPKEFITTLQGATPDVANLRVARGGEAVVTITNFLNGSEGHSLTILGDGVTTISHNTKIKTNSAANKLLSVETVYRFTFIDGVWVEDGVSGFDMSGSSTSMSYEGRLVRHRTPKLTPPEPTYANEETAVIFISVDTTTSYKTAIYGEISVNQVDGYGGFMSIHHHGAGDAIFVPMFAASGVALEASSFANGTKGIISTIQVADCFNSTLFNAVWDQATVCGYGMFYADQAVNGAFMVRRRSAGVRDDLAMFAVRANTIDYDFWAVLGDGTTIVGTEPSDAITTVRQSRKTKLRGSKWNGVANEWLDLGIRNDPVVGTSRLRIDLDGTDVLTLYRPLAAEETGLLLFLSGAELRVCAGAVGTGPGGVGRALYLA